MARQSCKKARVESPHPVIQVKQESPELAEPAMPAAVVPRATIQAKVYVSKLLCPLCEVPLKPPVYQCGAAHLACGACYGQIPNHQCRECGHGGAYDHNPALDDMVRSVLVECPYQPYGCREDVPYVCVQDHGLVCPHAPCSCPEPGCGFLGSPAVLPAHFAAAHSWRVTVVRYGEPRELSPPPPPPLRREVLVGEQDQCVFLVTLGARAAGADTAVSLVCVRANAEAAPQFKGELQVQAGSDKESLVTWRFTVRSSDLSRGFEETERRMSLAVPQALLDEVPAGEPVVVSVLINQL